MSERESGCKQWGKDEGKSSQASQPLGKVLMER